MKAPVLLLALAACNDVFGLHATKLRDGDVVFFDAPTDAPFQCPAIATAPMFKTNGQVVITQQCTGYSRSDAGNLAVASCPTMAYQAPLSATTMQPSLFGGGIDPASLTVPQLAPEGDTLYVVHSVMPGQEVLSFTRATDDSWQNPTVETIPISTTPFAWNHSSPTAAPGRRLLGIGNDSSIHEYAEQSPHTWTDLGAVPGTLNDAAPQITSDGLRLVATAVISNQITVVYAARASLAEAFPAPAALAGIPVERYSPFLTSDCGKLYMSDLSEVLVVEQQ